MQRIMTTLTHLFVCINKQTIFKHYEVVITFITISYIINIVIYYFRCASINI